MSKKVFILGAGFNQFLKKDFNRIYTETIKDLGFSYEAYSSMSLGPPMSKNFFKYALTRQFHFPQSSYHGINNVVLNYIEESFNRPRASLLYSDFDLELFFSILEGRINDAKNEKEEIRLKYLEEIRLNLIIAIGDIFLSYNGNPLQGRIF